MKHDEDGWQLEPAPFEDETDPSFPARLGERGAASARGSLNVPGTPRIDQTNPHFLLPAGVAGDPESKIVTKKPLSKEPTREGLGQVGEVAPPVSASIKDAVTQERSPQSSQSMPSSQSAPPVSSAPRDLNANLLAGIAPALAPDESGLRERVQGDDERERRATNESIDELIDGLPFEASLPRKKSARRLREEEESRPKRPPLPSLTAQGPLHTGTGDVGAALRERAVGARSSRGASLVPAGLAHGRTPLIGGAALLAALILAAFFVARSTNPPTAAPSAASPVAAAAASSAGSVATVSVENIPPPPPAAAPTEGNTVAESAVIPRAVVAPPSASDNAAEQARESARARARNAHPKRVQSDDGTGLDTSSLDTVPTKAPPASPPPAAAPSASPVPSSEEKLLTGH